MWCVTFDISFCELELCVRSKTIEPDSGVAKNGHKFCKKELALIKTGAEFVGLSEMVFE